MSYKAIGSSNKQQKNIINVEELHCTLSKNLGLLSISEHRTRFIIKDSSILGNLNLYFDASRLAVSQCQQYRPKELSLSPLYQNGKLFWSIFFLPLFLVRTVATGHILRHGGFQSLVFGYRHFLHLVDGMRVLTTTVIRAASLWSLELAYCY